MARTVSAAIERFPVAGVFNIARGAKRHVDVVHVTITENGCAGQGEGTPVYYHGETANSVLAQVEAVRRDLRMGASRHDLLQLMPSGAARNAVDCALWSLEAQLAHQPVWALAGLPPPVPVLSAYTISLGSTAGMEAAAREARAWPLLKLKLDGANDAELVAAVRRGAPRARLIVDANEAWRGHDIAALAADLLPFGVQLIEQPVPAGEDVALDNIRSPIPLCADESCQDRTSLPAIIGRYQVVNIKLDKCGGLTEALLLADAARAAGLDVMTGCMLATSLGISPALLLAQQSRWVDLDGPLLLARDRDAAVPFSRGMAGPPPPPWDQTADPDAFPSA